MERPGPRTHRLGCASPGPIPLPEPPRAVKHRLGACSWSLQVESLSELCERLHQVGVDGVQLALDPVARGAWSVPDIQREFEAAGLELRSGMMGTIGEDYTTLETIRETGGVRPTRHWEANLAHARACADAAHALGLDLVSFHAGFLPHEAGDPERGLLVGRLQQVADAYAERGVRVAFETGQETAETLLGVLDEIGRDSVGVNFDPANMLLYAMGEPVEALRLLAPRVFQVHIKDAVQTEVPGTWGEEVPVGTGQVDWAAFFEVLNGAGLGVDLMIEREAGSARVEDMRTARALLEGLGVVEVSA